MKQFKMLVLTDHTNHSKENSLYALVQAMEQHPQCARIDVASRGLSINNTFFKEHSSKIIYATKAKESFAFNPLGLSFTKTLVEVSPKNYDVIWLRMPPPLSQGFLDFLETEFPDQIIINDPKGITETGSKSFLVNFQEWCAPMKICRSVDDIIEFKNQFPIVLKPFREYGGKGIIRVDGDTIWEGNAKYSFVEFVATIKNQPIEFLAVQFLKNVSKGDKRIVVVNGEILGASLRLPAKDSWLCNVAMGGQSIHSKADEIEIEMVKSIQPILSKMGIVMYGVDTLMGNDGQRVLSEINTTSIGGLPQIATQTGRPVMKKAIQLIGDYILQKMQTNVRITK
ncbi:MAG: glutathione synthase [Paraglaciecola sp.]|jgi:glutathione synthase